VLYPIELAMQDFMEFDGLERRHKTRFPLELRVCYAAGGRREIAGAGRTVNISSRGVLITSAHELSPDTSIRVAIEWPVLINDTCPLALHIRGTVVRSEAGLVAVRIAAHEMRTLPKPPDRLQRALKSRDQSSIFR
jgi:PilZ domain